MSKLVTALASLLSACTPAPHAPAPPSDPVLSPWPEVRAGKLANGLAYYVLPRAGSTKRAYVYLVVQAGSLDEDDDQLGVAHLVEHLAFSGGQRFPGNGVLAYLDSIGSRHGIDLDASASWDRTAFHVEVPTDQPAYLDQALAIVHDWAGGLTLDDAAIAKERDVVREEARASLGANRRIADKQLQVTYLGSRYARRPPNAVPTASRDAIVRFYRDWYRPDRMAVIVVGDVDAGAVEARIRSELAPLASPTPARARTLVAAPARGTRVSLETEPEATGSRVSITSLIPHRRFATRADLRRRLVEELYARVLTWRLEPQTAGHDALASEASVRIGRRTAALDAFEVSVLVNGARVDQALRTVIREQRRVHLYGVGPTELELARRVVARRYEDVAVTAARRDADDQVRVFVDSFLAGDAVVDPKATAELANQLLTGITSEDLAGAAAPFAGDRTIAIVAPSTTELPASDKVIASLEAAMTGELGSWPDAQAAEPLMDRRPAPGSITGERALPAFAGVEWTLSNGARVVVAHVPGATDRIDIVGAAPGGRALVDDADIPEARFATTIATLGGAGARTPRQINAALEGKDVKIQTTIDDFDSSIAASGSVRDVEPMLQLLYSKMAAPRYDAVAFGAWRLNEAERTSRTERNPETAFDHEVRAATWLDSPRHVAVDADRVAALDGDKAMAIYRARFGDASGFTFAIAGDVDPAALRPLVERYLASLPATGHAGAPPERGDRHPPGVLAKTWHHGHDPKAQVRFEFYGDEPITSDAKFDLWLLKSTLRIRLRELLREDKGGVYSLAVYSDLDGRPRGERDLEVRFTCDPARVDELGQAVLDELAHLAHDGPSPELVAIVRKTLEQNLAGRDSGGIAAVLAHDYLDGFDPSYHRDELGRLTAATIQAASAKLADPSHSARFVMLPEP